MNKNEWINYGDVNQFDGAIYVQRDDTCKGWRVVKTIFEYDRKVESRFIIEDLWIDNRIGQWIDKESVMRYIGMDNENFNHLIFMLGAIDYYGPQNFGSSEGKYYNEDGLIEELKKYGIPVLSKI